MEGLNQSTYHYMVVGDHYVLLSFIQNRIHSVLNPEQEHNPNNLPFNVSLDIFLTEASSVGISWNCLMEAIPANTHNTCDQGN